MKHLRESNALVSVLRDQTCEKGASLQNPGSDYGGSGACNDEWEATKHDSEVWDP